ncbi:MAG: UDP-glucose 4-epimerase [Colwellia sp.]|jgi:UDP-glucose 4-epimerase
MICITGATGFLGKHLVDVLKNNLVLTSRSSFAVDGNSCFIKNVNQHTNYSDMLTNVSCIIHCAGRVHILNDKSTNSLQKYREVNTKGTLNLAKQAVKAGVKRFIFISSIKVNGESTKPDKAFTAFDNLNPEDFYSRSKAEAEVQLLHLAANTELEVVIIRPTLVYGPGVKANFSSLLNLVYKGIPLPFGCITKNTRSLVSVTNLVDLIVTCIEHTKAVNQVFLVSDDNDVSTASMVNQMSKALGKRNRMLPVPLWCYRLVGKAFGKQDVVNRLLGSLQVDISHTKKTLGWVPPQTIEEGFKETAEAFLLNKK